MKNSIVIARVYGTVNCGDSAQNTMIQGVLAKTVQSGAIRSSADGCGIIYWSAILTDFGANTMRSTQGVPAVVPDIKLEMAPPSGAGDPPPTQRRSQSKTSHLDKRSSLVKQLGDGPGDLRFVQHAPVSDHINPKSHLLPPEPRPIIFTCPMGAADQLSYIYLARVQTEDTRSSLLALFKIHIYIYVPFSLNKQNLTSIKIGAVTMGAVHALHRRSRAQITESIKRLG